SSVRVVGEVPIACHCSIALKERVLRFRIQRCSRLVKHDQKRFVAHKSTRQRKLLPLTKTDVDTTWPGLSKLRLETFIQSLNYVPGPRAGHRGCDGRHVLQAR